MLSWLGGLRRLVRLRPPRYKRHIEYFTVGACRNSRLVNHSSKTDYGVLYQLMRLNAVVGEVLVIWLRHTYRLAVMYR